MHTMYLSPWMSGFLFMLVNVSSHSEKGRRKELLRSSHAPLYPMQVCHCHLPPASSCGLYTSDLEDT